MRGIGLVRINTDPLYGGLDTIRVYNLDSTIFGKVYGAHDEPELVLALGGSVDMRVYHPDYGLLYADCVVKGAGRFDIVINGERKWIEARAGVVTFEEWGTLVATCILETDSSNPVLMSPRGPALKVSIDDYSRVWFEVTEMQDDWVRVKCIAECEGCGELEPFGGWIRWREGERLLVQLSYVC